MISPLLPFVNSQLLVNEPGVPEISEGRVTATEGSLFLVECYLKRQDGTGTTTGADYLPQISSPQSKFPGASGDVYLYRGYALRYVEVPEDFVVNSSVPPSSGWTTLLPESLPSWLAPGAVCTHVQGGETIKNSKVERSTGEYGGRGIDSIVGSSIVGVPIVVRSGDLTG